MARPPFPDAYFLWRNPEKRVALLEQQLRVIEGSMERLAEDAEFRRQLEAPHG